jgi:hypothetical protein
VYIDDLAIIVKNPQEIANVLMTKHKFKLKGTGPIKFHLGMDFCCDSDGVMCITPKKYIKKIMASYEQFFGTKPSQKFTSPLEKGNHPETDDLEFLNSTGMQQYQSLIRAMQWAVSIGRLDITTAVMTLSSFHAMPQRGHLDCVKRVYGYLSKMREAIIHHVHTDEADYS